MTKVPQKVTLLDLLRPPAGQKLRTAILTTFDLDLDYLERVALPTLVDIEVTGVDREVDSAVRRDYLLELRSRLRRSNVIVLADKRRFFDGDSSSVKSFETYELLFAESYPAFHPKVSLLAFDKEFRIVVSSANLTESGYHSNLEVLWMASLEQGDRFGHVASECIAFLDSVRKREWQSSRILKEAIADLKARAPRGHEDTRLLHSGRPLSILRQWLHEVGKSRQIEEVHIVSPYFDQGGRLSALAQFGNPQVHLYLTERLRNSTPEYRLPISQKTLSRIKPECHVISSEWMCGACSYVGLEAKKTSEKTSRVLHAKVYAVRVGKRGWALIGSPNFSHRAMLASFEERNAEAAIALNGSWKEISRLLPTISHTVPWGKVLSAPLEKDSTSSGWLPFLTFAEYDATKKKLMLVFSQRQSHGRWSVVYQDSIVLAGAGAEPFPTVHEMTFSIHDSPSLVLKEGRHKAIFPIGVTGKEMLPELPGMDALNYEDILEMLADGVVNMRQFLVQARDRLKPKPSVHVAECRVTCMDKLAQFTRAMESMKRRLAGELTTPAEAKSLFEGDMGFNRLVQGVVADAHLDIALRHLFLLEFLGVVSSVSWNGRQPAKRVAAKLAAQSIRALRCHLTDSENAFGERTETLRKIRKLYLSRGAEGWSRP